MESVIREQIFTFSIFSYLRANNETRYKNTKKKLVFIINEWT